MLIIPAIDLKDGRCVRLTQGRKLAVKTYAGDPLAIAKEFETAGAQILHVVDLDGAFGISGSPNRELVRQIMATVNVPVEFGGGLGSLADVAELVDAGVARVVIGTLAFESAAQLRELVRLFGARICVGIDARAGQVSVRGWEQQTQMPAVELARRVAADGVERIVYTDISRDGMLAGPNIEQTIAIAQASGLRVTASGGVSSLSDICRLRAAGEPLIDSVIIGKALYEGRFRLEEAITAAQGSASAAVEGVAQAKNE
jgi:phosphoribosylformimino-5-aminoimidazole carboxamide ribotide isomerase